MGTYAKKNAYFDENGKMKDEFPENANKSAYCGHLDAKTANLAHKIQKVEESRFFEEWGGNQEECI